MSLGRNIAVLLVMAMLSALGIGLALWWLLGSPPIQLRGSWTAAESFDFTKIVLSIVGGIGGVVALVVVYRKQRLGEAAEQRENAKLFAENFTKATEQLGSENAPVRLAGMYALERLAQTPEQQQTIVNVLCAYLRIPYTPPMSVARDSGEHPETTVNGEMPDDPTLANRDMKAAPRHGDEERRREHEQQVRLTAQRILTRHLHPGNPDSPADTFWADIDLDLTAATLVDFDLDKCQIRHIRLKGAQFHGQTRFVHAQFDRVATFDGAQFHDDASFVGAQFRNDARFVGVQFRDNASFGGTQFNNDARFDGVQFRDNAVFGSAKFHGHAIFTNTQFHDHAIFTNTQFRDNASFGGAQFHNDVRFDSARVRIDVSNSNLRRWPTGYAVVEPHTSAEAYLPNVEGTWWYLLPVPREEGPHIMTSTDEDTV